MALDGEMLELIDWIVTQLPLGGFQGGEACSPPWSQAKNSSGTNFHANPEGAKSRQGLCNITFLRSDLNSYIRYLTNVLLKRTIHLLSHEVHPAIAS